MCAQKQDYLNSSCPALQISRYHGFYFFPFDELYTLELREVPERYLPDFGNFRTKVCDE
jgi:hypothetical protein